MEQNIGEVMLNTLESGVSKKAAESSTAIDTIAIKVVDKIINELQRKTTLL